MTLSTRKARLARLRWQPVAAIYALAIFTAAAVLRVGVSVFGWSLGLGN